MTNYNFKEIFFDKLVKSMKFSSFTVVAVIIIAGCVSVNSVQADTSATGTSATIVDTGASVPSAALNSGVSNAGAAASLAPATTINDRVATTTNPQLTATAFAASQAAASDSIGFYGGVWIWILITGVIIVGIIALMIVVKRRKGSFRYPGLRNIDSQ